jgi:hypothetical protein
MTVSPTLFDFADGKRKHKSYADTKRAEVLAEKAEDDSYLIKEWKSWRQSEIRAIATLKAAPTWDAIDPTKLLAGWQSADHKTQALARRVVNAFVASKREEAGLVPYDDPVPSFKGGEL